MPTCQNCGNHVTERYMAVFAPPSFADNDEVRACQDCTRLRDGAEIRQARSRQPGQTGKVDRGETPAE